MKAAALIFPAILGMASVPLILSILNHMPARCFCDYDETPDERHQSPRVTLQKQGLPAGLFLTVSNLLLGMQFGLSVKTLVLCLFFAVLVMISLSDLRFSIIPDELLIAGAVFAVLSAFGDSMIGALFGALLGSGLILLMNLLGRLLYHKDALGMGDLKLMAVCGLACGPTGIAVAMVLGVLTAGICFAVAMAIGRMKSDQYSPLGPFLVFGVIFTICCRPAINAALAWYVSLL